jgi:tetraprenyl-beta-curcumene synthase
VAGPAAGGAAGGAPASCAAVGARSLRLAFLRGGVGYWTSVFPRVCLLLARWRRRARRIPDPLLRRVALRALAKRANIEGAAAFAAFAPRRGRADAVRAAAAFQCAYNLLDLLGEQPSADPVLDGRRLHEALAYAIAPGAARRDWYEHHPQRRDGGYLDALLDECREAFARLPGGAVVAPWARQAAERIVAFQSLNLSEAQGDHRELQRWAERATPAGSDLRWWETAAAAGSSLAVHALIAAAAEDRLAPAHARALADAYFPWIGCLHSLLDNLVDKREDEAAGHRSLLAYYEPARAAARLDELTARAARAADGLPAPARHRVMLAAMIANYLSSDDARASELRPLTAAVAGRAGALLRPSLLVFRLRRLALWAGRDRVA